MRRTPVFGLEWECAFGVEGSRRGPVPFEAAYSRLRHALCETSPWLPDGGNGIFTPGFRYYLDTGIHPEVASPEVTSPLDFIELKSAIFALLGKTLKQIRRHVPGLVLLANNHDYLARDSYWGCHESYSLSSHPERLSGGMLPFLATRPLIAGNGRIDRQGRVLLSSRAQAMRMCVGGETTRDRALYSTCRDEPLMQNGPFRHRLHLICGDSVASQSSEFLKLATTLLVLAWLDQEPQGADDLKVASPLRLLKSCNVLWSPPGKLHISRQALNLQFAYLARIEKFVEKSSWLPAWSSLALSLWAETLRSLREDPLTLTRRLDPFIKLALFEAALGKLGRRWSDIAEDVDLYHQLALLDVNYHRVEEGGLFQGLDDAGHLDQRILPVQEGRSIQDLVRRLPTRAAPRAEAIAALSGKEDYVCGWSGIFGGHPPRRLDLGDPTRSKAPDWQSWSAVEALPPSELLLRWHMQRRSR